MPRRYDLTRKPKSLSAQEAEELFSKVDNSGHTDEESAERQRKRRKEKGHGVDVDPLSTDDPSGSNVGSKIRRTAVVVLLLFVGIVVLTQVYVSAMRAEYTANLSNNVSVLTVAQALDGGVEWGNGFTQFSQEFSVQEADENTGRIEVTVIDTTSADALSCFSASQIQAAALSVNSLLNPNINTVIFHVNVYRGEDGEVRRSSFFSFFKPTGDLKPFITFIWTKNTTPGGQVTLNCTISGVDDELQELLRDQITSRFTPSSILGGAKEDDATVMTTEDATRR